MSLPDAPPLADVHKEVLLQVARAAVEHGLGGGDMLAVDLESCAPEVQVVGATFITLRLGEALRGCVGSVQAVRPLVVDAAHNAHGAAFRDPRFSPLRQTELAGLSIHVSILGPFEELRSTSEAELLAQLQPGEDGLFLEVEGARHRAILLPSVWTSLPDAATFLHHLKIKAGLPRYYWSDNLKVWRYNTESFSDARNKS